MCFRMTFFSNVVPFSAIFRSSNILWHSKLFKKYTLEEDGKYHYAFFIIHRRLLYIVWNPPQKPPKTMSLKRWSDKRGIPWQYTSFYVFMHAKQVIQIFSSEPFGEIHSNEGQRSHSWRYQKRNSKFISPFPQDQLSQISTNHNLI